MGISDVQRSDFAWYKDNLVTLYKQYGEKYVVIKNQTVLGSYDTAADAIKAASESETIGTFIVQKCGADENTYTIKIANIGLR